MAWEYLDNHMGYRYKLADEAIDFTGMDVVDLCSGDTGMYELVKDKVASYRACDVRKLHPIVEQMPDDEFVKTIKKCDILCVFGHGGYEITKESLESATLTDSIKFLIAKFNPVLILECVTKFQPILEDITKDHKVKIIRTVGSDWLTDRVLYIGENYAFQVKTTG